MKTLIKTLFALAITVLAYACDKPTPDPEPTPDPIQNPEVSYTASLSYAELGSSASAVVAGYGERRTYKNTFGTWEVCAFDFGRAFQLNSNKVCYIGTPEFESSIFSITINTYVDYHGEYYICSKPGEETISGLVMEVPCTGTSTTIVIDGDYRHLYIRSDGCVRIASVDVVVNGTQPSVDPQPDPDPDPDPDPQPDPDPNPGSSAKYGWYELPVIVDKNLDGKNDDNGDLYYAYHQFSMNSKKYRNYTVCYDGYHHCPMWIAAPRHSMYVGSSGRSNAYQRDPDIPANLQYSSKSTGGGCNKGHMLGSAERTCCSEANTQVFYYTNIAPQLSSGFNTGGGGWNILEDYIDDLVVKDTLYEVIGCYFETFSDGYGNTVSPKTIEFGGRSDVSSPTMFYYVLLRTKKGTSGKKVVDCSADELQCVAFVRCHTNNLMGQKPSSKELMSVSDLEKVTGVTYFPNIPNAPKSTFKASDWGL